MGADGQTEPSAPYRCAQEGECTYRGEKGRVSPPFLGGAPGSLRTRYRVSSRLMRPRTILLSSLLFFIAACSADYSDPIMEPSDPAAIGRGRELVRGLAACGYCHGERNDPAALLSGGRYFYDQYGDVAAPNITPDRTGLQGWSAEQIVVALRAGQTPDERKLSPEVHTGYEWMADTDILSIIAYLRTVPPVANEVPRREVGFMERNTIGLLDQQREVRGFIPAVDPAHEVQYGQYLVENVARCTSCHNRPGSIFTSESYLDGGAAVRTPLGERIAPNITGSRIYGIGDWKIEQITDYLATGRRPDRTIVESAFCPVNFYANASERDRRAIARYLLAVVAE